MKRFIFGFDTDHPERCALHLREKGFDAVVLGSADPRTEEALAKQGLELYLCFGALSLTEGIPGRPPLAEDACGTPVRWFSSGCPNSTTLRSYHLKRALERLSDTHSARGLFVDGARFASAMANDNKNIAHTKCFRAQTLAGGDHLISQNISTIVISRRFIDSSI